MTLLHTLRQTLSRRRRIAPGRRLRRLATGAVLCLMPLLAFAQTSAVRPAGGPAEDNVKAAYLLKFLNYVEWPAGAFAAPDSPYVIGVVNDEGLLAELQRQAVGHTVNRRPVTLRRVGAGEPPTGLHAIFIGGRTERARQAALLRQLRAQPVLAVTDTDGALELGSMINFRLVDERVRFEVALDPVRHSGLELNTRLLSVAIAVNKGTQP